ncbi:MAG: peptidylprolyl isomerase [Myxococcota bacterium]
MVSVFRSVLREPLLQFLILGFVLFILDRARPRGDDPHRIEVSENVYRELADVFESTHGREPTAIDLQPAVDSWLTNEVLYREGRSLQLDRGDDMIRERVIQKMRVMVHGGVVVPKPAEGELEAWFEARRERYAQPDLLSFALVEFGNDKAAAEAKAAEVRRATAEGETLDAGGLRVIGFTRRPRSNVEAMFGADFTKALEKLASGEWTTLESRRGWHMVRMDEVLRGQTADFSRAKSQALKDWHQDTLNRQAWEAIEDVRGKYDIVQADLNTFVEARRAEAPNGSAAASGDGDDV